MYNFSLRTFSLSLSLSLCCITVNFSVFLYKHSGNPPLLKKIRHFTIVAETEKLVADVKYRVVESTKIVADNKYIVAEEE